MKILELIILISTAIVVSAFALYILFLIISFIIDEIKARIKEKK